MFQKIQQRLLLSYLLVFASILGIFAIAVRIFFTYSLTEQLTDRLTGIGQGVAADAEFKNNRIQIETDFSIRDLIARKQALQWFDSRGKLVFHQGKQALSLPFSTHETVQIQTEKIRLQVVTLPIIGSEDRKLIGYVRISESLEEFDETIKQLDWGLGGGIMIALALSSVGGVLLTRQAMQPIEQSFERLKQFTSDASHELRSPLMAIKTNANVALKYAEGMRETDVEKFQAIASATNQMTRLTEELLFLARTNKVPRQTWEILNLKIVLENLVQLYKPEAEAKQINLKYQANRNIYLRGDAVQLTRLFTNLLENAIHYTPSGGVVEIKTSLISADLYIYLQDTGIGIASENIPKIFERFWRADQSRSYWDGGSGLGLAIAQAIAQNHGGLITVASQLGIGSCFTVRLNADTSNIKLGKI